MAEGSNASMRAVIDRLRDKQDISLIDILSLAEVSVDSLRSTLDTIDSSIYREFREIASQISRTKSELGQLSTSDLRHERIPQAGLELHAIVEATEDATHRIMECAETIMTADPSDQATYHSIVNDNIMAIFEACSFQDITGQRISKVVETLEIIDKRVNRFAKAIGADETDIISTELDEEETKREQRKKDQLLNGPAIDGSTVSQDDIDSLFD